MKTNVFNVTSAAETTVSSTQQEQVNFPSDPTPIRTAYHGDLPLDIQEALESTISRDPYRNLYVKIKQALTLLFDKKEASHREGRKPPPGTKLSPEVPSRAQSPGDVAKSC